MAKITALVTFARDASIEDRLHLRASLEIESGAIVVDVVHGAAAGDLAWHLLPSADTGWLANARQKIAHLAEDARVAGVEAIAYVPQRVGPEEADLADGVHRTLLLALEDGVPAETQARFVADLTAMPDHVGEIRNAVIGQALWSFGRQRWTHVWEQEFATLSDLTGAYMAHPYHWGYVDRWFDAEAPERIVVPDLCHSAAAIGRSLIARYR